MNTSITIDKQNLSDHTKYQYPRPHEIILSWNSAHFDFVLITFYRALKKLYVSNKQKRKHRLKMFDAGGLGAFIHQKPPCRHRGDQNFIVLELKSLRIPFQGRALERIIRPLMDVFGAFKQEHTYDHHRIFVDVACRKCHKKAVYTLQFEKPGSSVRRGYYHHGDKQNDKIVCPKSWEVQFEQVMRFYNVLAGKIGNYSVFNNNCQDFTEELWPKLKKYVQKCKI